MRDEEKTFHKEAAGRDLLAKWYAKARAKKLGIEHICQIKAISTRAKGEKAVWHFPSRKRYFRINQKEPNNWGFDS